MKAIVQTGYGSPDVLQLRDIAVPEVDADGVLVRVHAASVNALDWHTTRGMPYLIRLFDGRGRPRQAVRGVDLAGRIEAVGKHVTGFKVGDEVFGGTSGSFAEYAITSPDRLALKPPTWSFEQAAALHVAGMTALQGLRNRAQLRSGQRVLINGAGGGVGTFAVQIAKWLGAHVTAVTRTNCLEVVRSLGADEVIDYRAQDFTRRADRYDVVFDIGGNRPLAACRRVLTKNGILIVVGAPAGRWVAPLTRLLQAAAVSPFVSQRLLPFFSKNDAADLALLGELATARRVVPVLDQQYSLQDTAEAVRYLGAGLARGKVVIRTI